MEAVIELNMHVDVLPLLNLNINHSHWLVKGVLNHKDCLNQLVVVSFSELATSKAL